MLQTILNRNLLKYSAGQHIFCPICNSTIADYRRWVWATSPSGATNMHCCDKCWREFMAPTAYLRELGWTVTSMIDLDKVPRKPVTFPQKAGKALDTYLRRAIFKSRKRDGWITKTDRVFPAESYGKPVDLIDTKTTDGFDSSYAENAQYSAFQVAEYVRKYCELNHLKVA